jgi:hypothetical protein
MVADCTNMVYSCLAAFRHLYDSSARISFVEAVDRHNRKVKSGVTNVTVRSSHVSHAYLPVLPLLLGCVGLRNPKNLARGLELARWSQVVVLKHDSRHVPIKLP